MRLITVMAAATSGIAGIDPAWLALAGAVFGGVGLKVVEAWLGRNKIKIDDATQIRSEMRTEISELRAENRALEKESNDWREKYYTSRDRILALTAFIIGKGMSPPEE